MHTMKRAFNIVNKYILLVTPLLLFVLFAMFFLIVTGLRNIFFSFLLILILVAFASGWFKMIKVASAKDVTYDNPNLLWKEFLQGVGEYFLPLLGAAGIAFSTAIILFIAGYLVGDLIIGFENIPFDGLKQAFSKPGNLEPFLRGLPFEQMKDLFLWYVGSLFVGFILYLLLILYLPTIFYTDKNPFKAFLISLKNLFSKYFFNTFCLLVTLTMINVIISFLTSILSVNLFVSGLMILVRFYTTTFIFVSIFCYYNDKFVSSANNEDKEVFTNR